MEENDELKAIKARKMERLMEMSRSPSEPIKISDETFDETIRRNRLVIVDFWAEWCGPCMVLSPVIDQLAKEYAGKVLFTKLNVDENPAVTARFGVMSIPTLLIFKDSNLVDKIVGVAPKSRIESVLNSYLSSLNV
ncbi:thioredoxin [Candidatus Bathyarchaeota archaeon]|nr:thioredoxin [Candidatus Bathyarchaeota archaeon]MBS7629439.1 thioredoxin [Candidatus Bathyarchaeota archaeon]